MNRAELQFEMIAKVQAVYKVLDEATAFAREHKLSFHFEPAYEMGGTYVGDTNIWEKEGGDGWRRPY